MNVAYRKKYYSVITYSSTFSELPVDGGWGEWSPWGQCRATCGPNQQTRYRECNAPYPQNGGKKCEGAVVEDQPCSVMDCPTTQPGNRFKVLLTDLT